MMLMKGDAVFLVLSTPDFMFTFDPDRHGVKQNSYEKHIIQPCLKPGGFLEMHF